MLVEPLWNWLNLQVMTLADWMENKNEPMAMCRRLHNALADFNNADVVAEGDNAAIYRHKRAEIEALLGESGRLIKKLNEQKGDQ